MDAGTRTSFLLLLALLVFAVIGMTAARPDAVEFYATALRW